METASAGAVGDALRATAAELRPWIEQRVGNWPPDRYGKVAPNDPAYLISVMLEHWRPVFAGALGAEGMTLVQEFRHTRNRWAHHKPFGRLEAFRAIDTCRLLLHAIGSDREQNLAAASLQVLNDAGPDPQPAPVRSGRMPQGLHRRSASTDFRAQQWERRFDPQVEPINRLVDDLIAEHGDRWMPYVAPYHGGIDTRILLVFQDPGRMTATAHGGSGFIGCENDDPSAALVAQCLDAAGVEQDDVMPWNSYPWFLPDQGGVSAAMRDQGLEPLRRLIGLLPDLDTVVTCGAVAHDTWDRFVRRYPGDAARVRHLKTFHTSGRGITNGGQQRKAVGVEHFVETLRVAAEGHARSESLGH